MRLLLKYFAPIMLTAALVSPAFISGCAVHERIYDPYYYDYHSWPAERSYYSQWEGQTHREHVDFKQRNEADKKAYWDWRHSHENH